MQQIFWNYKFFVCFFHIFQIFSNKVTILFQKLFLNMQETLVYDICVWTFSNLAKGCCWGSFTFCLLWGWKESNYQLFRSPFTAEWIHSPIWAIILYKKEGNGIWYRWILSLYSTTIIRVFSGPKKSLSLSRPVWHRQEKSHRWSFRNIAVPS